MAARAETNAINAREAVTLAADKANKAAKDAEDSLKEVKLARTALSKEVNAATATRADDAGRKAKRLAAAVFQAAEDVRRQASLADIAAMKPFAPQPASAATSVKASRKQV